MLSSEFIVESAQSISTPFDQYKFHDLEDPIHTRVTPVKSTEQLRDIIEANCGTMLAAYRSAKKVLYRGLETNDQIVITNIRPDRKPVEMHPTTHRMLATAFTKLGLKANRSNSIFCSTDIDIARQWGNGSYVIFIKDGWAGTVFKNVTTGYVFNKLVYGITDELDAIRKVKALLPKNVAGASALATVLRVGYEDVLITGESYIGILATKKDILFNILGFDHRTGKTTLPKVKASSDWVKAGPGYYTLPARYDSNGNKI